MTTIEQAGGDKLLSGYLPSDDSYIPPLDTVVERAREALAAAGTASIHDRSEMVRIAVAFGTLVHELVAAVDAERAMCRPEQVAAWRGQVAA